MHFLFFEKKVTAYQDLDHEQQKVQSYNNNSIFVIVLHNNYVYEHLEKHQTKK